jgi:hypothetical protein
MTESSVGGLLGEGGWRRVGGRVGWLGGGRGREDLPTDSDGECPLVPVPALDYGHLTPEE